MSKAQEAFEAWAATKKPYEWSLSFSGGIAAASGAAFFAGWAARGEADVKACEALRHDENGIRLMQGMGAVHTAERASLRNHENGMCVEAIRALDAEGDSP